MAPVAAAPTLPLSSDVFFSLLTAAFLPAEIPQNLLFLCGWSVGERRSWRRCVEAGGQWSIFIDLPVVEAAAAGFSGRNLLGCHGSKRGTARRRSNGASDRRRRRGGGRPLCGRRPRPRSLSRFHDALELQVTYLPAPCLCVFIVDTYEELTVISVMCICMCSFVLISGLAGHTFIQWCSMQEIQH
jgi:hypothetical protein